jgi:hypothetical protein
LIRSRRIDVFLGKFSVGEASSYEKVMGVLPAYGESDAEYP